MLHWMNESLMISAIMPKAINDSHFSLQTSIYFSIVVDKVDLGTAPITLSFFSPFLKNSTVGMLLIPYWVAMLGQSSVLSLQQIIFPAYSFASSSITGAIILHGPHHGAQNSTRTGFSLAITRLFQLESVTTWTAEFKHLDKLQGVKMYSNFFIEKMINYFKPTAFCSSSQNSPILGWGRKQRQGQAKSQGIIIRSFAKLQKIKIKRLKQQGQQHLEHLQGFIQISPN